MGFLDRLREGLTKTKQQIVSRFEEIVQQADAVEQRTRPIDVETIEALEELLISADVGLPATERIVAAVRSRSRRGESLRDLVKDEIRQIFDGVERPAENGHHPHVTLIVGVNGTGKTTTIGKLANLLKASGKTPLVCAADTFRAAAVDQLKIWGDRVGVPVVTQGMGADPASVAFDAVSSAKAQGYDVIIIDTAGRLHNKVNLMSELGKIKRVVQKVVPDGPHESLLVLDASTGQNAIEQCRQFTAATEVNALALTKLDGTAKGGVVIGISDQFKIPVKYIGVGEKIDDLQVFNKQEFVDSLFN